MKAILYTEYGSADVLRLIEVPQPVPGDDEILVRIHAASVNPYDWRIMTGKPFFIRFMMGGLRRPKPTRPGVDMSGVIVSVGKNITRFKPGDEVFGSCRGSFAEYACASESGLALKPANLTFERAAAVRLAATTALQGLRDHGGIKPGQTVLIDGASGGIGTFAIQIAKYFGAEITAVCSPSKMELARSLGAHHVIDYTSEDFTKNGKQYDLIFAPNGYHSIFAYRRALKENGRFVMAGGGWPPMLQAMLLGRLLSRFGNKTLGFFVTKINPQDLALLKDMLEAGTIVPVIDRCYALSDTAEAVRYLQAGHAKGKVVVRIVNFES